MDAHVWVLQEQWNKDGVSVGKAGAHMLLFCLLFDLQKLIEEESVNLLSNPVRQQAMIVVTNLRYCESSTSLPSEFSLELLLHITPRNIGSCVMSCLLISHLEEAGILTLFFLAYFTLCSSDPESKHLLK